MATFADLTVANLGEGRFPSPLGFEGDKGSSTPGYVSDSLRVRFDVFFDRDSAANPNDEPAFEPAGPRKKLFFDPTQTTAAIVTCGGLSPGLNNVIRSTYSELVGNYGVGRVLGISHGFKGLNPDSGLPPVTLTPRFVDVINNLGGSVLGTSRGPQPVSAMVDFLQDNRIDILFCIGGDGTLRGADALAREVQSRKRPIAIIGVPKTIDNDIPYVDQSFGYATALEKASEVIRGAHVEARGAVRGIGLVQLMGRNAGFIAAGACVVSQEANFCLIPEVPFPLEGEDGFLAALERRMRERGHAVVVVAEGAGQYLFDAAVQKHDKSGNPLRHDIGQYLRDRIVSHFERAGDPVALKYFDPSYYVRSVPANTYDRFLSDQLGRHAVHAAMAGKTDALVGFRHGQFIYVPIQAAVSDKRRLDPSGELWRAVLQSTRQPRW